MRSAALSVAAAVTGEGPATGALFLQGLVDGALRLGEDRHEVGIEALFRGAHPVARLIDRDRLRADGIELAPGGPEYLGRLISREIAQWTRVVREAGISATD